MRKYTKGFASLGVGCLATTLAQTAAADFLNDSKASLEMRNYYFNRDYREDDGQNKREEWAQGFLLNMQSGFTNTPVGFGIDLLGVLGLKLDSSPDRAGTGLLAQERVAKDGRPAYARRAQDEYSKVGVTAKARFAKTELRIGSLIPNNPLLQPNTSRISPQMFEGGSVTSNDIDNLTFSLIRIDQTKYRDSTDYQSLSLNRQFGAYGTATSDDFSIVGGDYKIAPDITASYYYSRLENIFQQHFAGFKYKTPLGPGFINAEARYFNASDTGSSKAGQVDNQAVSTRVGYEIQGHTLSAGLQKLSGDTPLVIIDGANSYLFSELQLTNFSQTQERTWHLKYDFDFVRMGIPGLTFSTSYFKGDQAEVKGFSNDQREWERNTSLTYVVQSGPLKRLSVRWLNAHNNSSYVRDMDENRLYFAYTLPIF